MVDGVEDNNEKCLKWSDESGDLIPKESLLEQPKGEWIMPGTVHRKNERILRVSPHLLPIKFLLIHVKY